MNLDINTTDIMLFLALIATIGLTVLAYLFIVPEKKRAGLNKLGRFLHDIFNFKFLIVEKVLQFFYVLCTIACVCVGISMIFGIDIYYSSYSERLYTDWYGIYGILLAVLGPIVVRLAYECLMLGLLLVKNVIQINKKLKSQTEEGEYQMPTFKDLVSKENFSFLKKTEQASAEQQKVQ